MKKIYAVYDKKAMFFSSPMAFDHLPQATRQFEAEVKNTNSQLNHYPEDFALYQIAEYDEMKGLLRSLDTPKHICDASEFLLPFAERSEVPYKPEQ